MFLGVPARQPPLTQDTDPEEVMIHLKKGQKEWWLRNETPWYIVLLINGRVAFKNGEPSVRIINECYFFRV